MLRTPLFCGLVGLLLVVATLALHRRRAGRTRGG